MTIVNEEKKVQDKYKEAVKAKISRQVKFIDNNLTDQQI